MIESVLFYEWAKPGDQLSLFTPHYPQPYPGSLWYGDLKFRTWYIWKNTEYWYDE